jgi:fumarylacetoacetate (FAA) hydrolase
MTCDVNRHRLSEGNADSMNWTFAQILQRTSYGIQMQPGEVIGSGTVGSGCLLELNGSKITDNLWLKAGDEVVMEVEGLGRLVNTVVHTPERLMGVTPNLLGGRLPDLYASSPTGEAGD